MRFLFADPNIEFLLRDEPASVGGASVQAFAWMRGLLANGEDVGCIARAPVERPTPEGLRVFPGYELSGGLGYLTSQYPFFRSVVDDYRPDFVYQGTAGTLTGLLAFLARGRDLDLVHMVANDADVAPGRRAGMRWSTHLAYRYGLRRTSAVLFQTDLQQEKVSERFPDKPCLRIEKPICLEDVPPGAGEEERSYLAWLGIFQWQKNLPALLEVARALPDHRFALAGRRSSRVDDETEAALDEFGRLDNVDFVGYLKRDEIFDFLGGAHALLSTSRFEGFPNTYLEAWAVGTPVLTLRSADPDGVVERRGLGGVADGPAGLADAIRSLAEDDLEPLRRHCRAYVRDRHDAVRQAARLSEWLASALGVEGERP